MINARPIATSAAATAITNRAITITEPCVRTSVTASAPETNAPPPAAIHHAPTGQRLAAERAYLAALDGSCETPIAGLAELDGGQIRLRGEILRPDGSDCLTEAGTAPVEDAAALGRDLGLRLKYRAGEGFFDWRERWPSGE